MNPTIKNILATIGGIIVGIIVNILLIQGNGTIIPLPEGVDVSSTEGLKDSIHLFKPVHFIFPFLGHAVGTLAGALVTAKFSASKHLLLALTVGAFFLMGGMVNVVMIPGPTWFATLDVILAYLPMGYLGWKFSGNPKA